ncbi:MAG: XdhC/CoxI family protein [Oscillospiraceae bacterium]|nr:XdhC/CoxI family protein [Oscillospiraceae bacterium]
MNNTLEFVHNSIEGGKKVALITITGITGSSPATPGQMIAVLSDGSSVGTVGGGATEHQVIQRAIEAINAGEAVFSMSLDHAENGMICGGSMEVFGNIIGNQLGLCIFGGGHIAQSLAKIAYLTGFHVTVVEDRKEFADNFENVNYITCTPDEYEVTAPAAFADYAVICTRGHSTDDKALRYCLTKNFKYVGMIGSKKKVTEIFKQLRNEGIKQLELDKIYTPIGLDIANAAPAEIAIAILAEILLIKNTGTLNHKSLR